MLEILFGRVTVAVKEKAAADMRAECPAVPDHGAVLAEKATTDRAGLQLQVLE
jgi:hypothetical protein